MPDTNPNYPNYQLSDRELVSLCFAFFKPTRIPTSNGGSRGPGGTNVGDIFNDPNGAGGPGPHRYDDPLDAVALAVAIVKAESSGVTNALRPASKNSLGGNDRGIWQWNDKAHPDISDDSAYDPIAATSWAWLKSAHGTEWGPWAVGQNSYRGRERTDLRLSSARGIVEEHKGNVMSLDDIRGVLAGIGIESQTGPNSPNTVTTSSFLDPAFRWAQALGDLLAVLLTGEFWRRLGIGLLGALLIIGAVVLANRDAIPIPGAKLAT